MPELAPLYLGFDLSTQQLKGLAVNSDLKAEHEVKFDFDADAKDFNLKKGVLINDAEHEVFAPLAMWLQAIDAILQRFKEDSMDFSRVRGISGAGMQHGSVYWSETGIQALECLDNAFGLEEQLVNAFSHPYSPNWQDASTQNQCDIFDRHLGNEKSLADITGSKAHHIGQLFRCTNVAFALQRFTGPQILRFRTQYPGKYEHTSRICLVSSFLASIFLGRIAPIDISDIGGMNLWDIRAGVWNEKLLALAAGSSDTSDLKRKLGAADVPDDGGVLLGRISPYFLRSHGFDQSCAIIPSTGDNPSTILALPLRASDAIVSRGTSTTFLMNTPHYKPNPAVHFMNHPTSAGYMFMWQTFNDVATSTPPIGQAFDLASDMRVGLFFPRPEIVPNVRAGTWRFSYKPMTDTLVPADDTTWHQPQDDARAIVESQFLSLRLRSKNLVESPTGPNAHLPPQPRRIYLVGGGSRNAAIAKIAGEVLGGWEGVYRLDVGENACALGAAYKAVWAVERKSAQSFEELIGGRWREEDFVAKVAEGYQEEICERYGAALEVLASAEKEVLKRVTSP
ncbi:MAG: hypothetical protein Q9173_000783 [Seirophora scorigena]